MKGVVVTTDEKVKVQDFGEPLYKTAGEAVGGYIEIVHPRHLERPFVMIVNEEGLNLGLEMNIAGSILCGTHDHGSPIVGNIVIMIEGFRNGEPDLVGLTDDEVTVICSFFENMHVKYREEMLK